MRRPRKRKNSKTRQCVAVPLLTALFVILFVSGSFGSPEAVSKMPDAEKNSLLAQKTGTDYFYDRRGKTDPFKSFIAEQEEVEKKKRRKPRTYLETLDLSQLDLIAIVVGPKGNYAMVRDAKGLGYVIKKGTPIGINGGVVHQVKEEEVVIRERGSKDVSKKLYGIQ
jgi:Tfp pilus assembly protein PilP